MSGGTEQTRGLAMAWWAPAQVTAFGTSVVAPAGAVVAGLVLVVSFAGLASAPSPLDSCGPGGPQPSGSWAEYSCRAKLSGSSRGPALAVRRASRAGYQPVASTFGFWGVPRTRGGRSTSTWTPATWRSTGPRSGGSGQLPGPAGGPAAAGGLGRDVRNHTIGMMCPSAAMTDSNYIGLTGPGVLRGGG